MNSNHSFGLKTLAATLSLCLIAVSLPMYAFADGGEIMPDSIDVQNMANVSKAEIVEIKEKRAAKEKTFRLNDGNFYIAHYDTEIHEEDENGDLVDIDNRLYKNGEQLSTKNGRFSFPCKTSEDSPLFSLSEKEGGVSFVLNNAFENVTGEITNQKTEFEKDTDRLKTLTTLDNIKSSVTYRDILPNTDVEYVLLGKNVKENIILKERKPQPEYVYSFILFLETLVPVNTENRQIDLVDPATGETVYFLPAPVMWDSAGKCSDSVKYNISPGENGTYALNVTADADWINDENRVFPITIDPSVYSTSSNVLDTYISSSSPSSSYSGSTILNVSETQRAYLKFTSLPVLPKSAYVTKAELSVHCYYSVVVSGHIGVYDVLTDWDSTLTWNKTVSSSSPAGQIADAFTDCRPAQVSMEPPSFNITPIVKKWYDGENFGVALSSPSGTVFNGVAYIYSCDYSTASFRPSLCITYSDVKGLEDYWSYTVQDAGFAGQAYINNATGNLVVNIPTLSTTDFLMPLTVSLVYNHCMYFDDYKYPNVQTANTTAFTPRSFKLNLNETLIKKEYTDASGNTAYYIIWADSDGTEHYFFPTSDEGTTYEDEDGLHLKLTPDGVKYKMTDSNDTVKTFNTRSAPSGTEAAWYLSDITDKSGNSVHIYVNTTYYYPTRISLKPGGSLPEIDQLRIEYNSAKKPCIVWNPTTGEGVVLQYSNVYNSSPGTAYGNYLRKVIRAHINTVTGSVSTDKAKWTAFYNTNDVISTSDVTVDAVAEYNYNYLGIMTKISNTLTGYRLNYNVFSTSKKVSGCREAELISSANGQKLGYTYGTLNTVVRSSGKDDIHGNSDDLITTYTFDNNGRVVNCYTTDLNKTQIFGASGGQYVGEENTRARNSVKSSAQMTQQSSNYLLNGGFEADNRLQYWSTTGEVSTAIPGVDTLNLKAVSLKIDPATPSSSLYQTVNLTAGNYSLSADIFTYEVPDGIRAYLKATSLSNSSHSFTKEIPVNKNNESGGEYSVSLDFTSVPATTGGTEQFKIAILVEGVSSAEVFVDVDNIMLSKTTGSAEYDFTTAGHFETVNPMALPVSFWKYDAYPGTLVSVIDSGDTSFGKALYVNASFTDDRCVSQKIYQANDEMRSAYYLYNNSSPILLKVSGWAKGTGQSYADSALFDIALRIKYYNGTTQSQERIYPLSFERSVTEWQLVSGSVITEPGYGMVDSIEVLLRYKGHQGTCFFDNISVNVNSESANAYEYGSLGYLSKATTGSKTTAYEYDTEDGNKVIRTVNTGNRSITEYTYDGLKRLSSEKVSRYSGVYNPNTGLFSNNTTVSHLSETDYTYNTYGLVTQTLVKDLAATDIKTRVQTEYVTSSGSHIFGAVSKETDVLGNETKYFYGTGSDTGRLKALIYPDGKGTCYTYDRIGNITEVLPATVSGTTYSATFGSSDVIYGYDSATKRLSAITTTAGVSGTTTYSFAYDNFGNTTETKVGTRTLASYSYNQENGKLNTLVYGNGLNVQYVYDSLDRISEIKYRNGSSGSFSAAYKYSYTSAGSLHTVTDCLNGNEQTVYEYDSGGRTVSVYTVSSSGSIISGTNVSYDDESRVRSVFDHFGYSVGSAASGESLYYTYSYNQATGNLSQLKCRGTNIVCILIPEYDNIGRTESKSVDINLNGSDAFYNKLEYSYVSNGGYASGRVLQYDSLIRRGENTAVLSSSTYKYTYDPNGNITEIRDAGNVVQNKYYYDAVGQLTREDNRAKGETVVYSYDKSGNITQKQIYPFTTGTLGSIIRTVPYYYSDATWKDLLGNYNGQLIYYDAAGNPTSIGTNALTWRGRELTGYSAYTGFDLSYAYNADGIRTEKTYTTGGTSLRHEYTLSGTEILKETVYSGNTERYTLIYIYDENGSPIGYRYRTPAMGEGVFEGYFFEKNLQGDVIAVYNQSGTKLVSYVYDAWGSHTVTYLNGGANTPAQYNPFRYRSYYFDTETNFYYLQSRYYNPAWGRFINADGQLNGSLLGYNLFAYCENNPVNYVDPDGEAFISIFVALLVIAAVPLVLSSCNNSNEGLEDTPADPRGSRWYNSYDEALEFALYETQNIAKENNFSVEYGTAIIQFKDTPGRYYVTIPHTDNENGRIIADRCWPSDDINVVLNAFIHTHPWEYSRYSSPFNNQDINSDNYLYADKYIIDNKRIYRLAPGIKDYFSGWEIYK